jgi:hypothetical protein
MLARMSFILVPPDVPLAWAIAGFFALISDLDWKSNRSFRGATVQTGSHGTGSLAVGISRKRKTTQSLRAG